MTIPQTRQFHLPFLRLSAINHQMKTILSSALLIACGLLFSGCETDLPPTPKAEPSLSRGLKGQGTIVPIDQKNDPMINETTGSVH
ncbi:MAG: hypothetical protein NTX04_01280 [Verrucomicrobia bacterium]|nr:hypothetical protein [Verrucomicrobiota bacterium]